MTSQLRQRSPLPTVLTLLIAGLVAGALAAPQAVVAHEADGRPARIHEGTCDALGRVVHQLTGVGAGISVDGTPIAAPEAVGAEDAVPIALSTTTLETAMADLTDSPHAIAIYESDEAMDRMLVCGNIGGAMMMQMPGTAMPGDELVIWLSPVGESAAAGVALLRSEVGGASSVTVMLADESVGDTVPAGEHGDEATPGSG